MQSMDYFDNLTNLEKDDIRRKIDEGLESIRLGRASDGEAFMAELMADLGEEIDSQEGHKGDGDISTGTTPIKFA